MLARHSITYLVARGVPAVVNFATIVIFSRLLTPTEYGHYAVGIAWMLLLSSLLFDWLRLSTLRLLPNAPADESEFLAAVGAIFAFLTLLLGVGCLLVLQLAPLVDARYLLVVPVLSILHAYHELSAELARARLRPMIYGAIAAARSAGALAVGTLLITAGLGGIGALAGLAVALAVVGITIARHQWRGYYPSAPSRALVRRIVSYGLPLSASLGLHYVMSMSDRLIIERLLGPAAAGQYAVAYDLPRQSLGTLMLIVTLAGLPLAVRQMDSDGIVAASWQLKDNGGLLFAIALPATVGLCLLAAPIAAVIVGPEFRATSGLLIPWIAVGVFLHGLKAFYVDHVFVLTRRLRGQLVAAAVGAASNVAGNLILIPRLGLLGAAYSTLGAYLLALLVSVVLARKQFPLHLPRSLVATGLATLAMATTLLSLPGTPRSVIGLATHVGIGLVVFCAAAFVADTFGMRARLVGKVRTAVARGSLRGTE